MNRTTRSVSLTEAGEQLLARARPAIGELASAVDQARNFQHHPAGLLRLVVQPPVASFLIGPILARFLSEYPGVRVDVAIVKMPADIIREGFDAGIRLGEQIERDMIALRVIDEPKFLVVASPDYLAHHPAPDTPRDLQSHDCIRNRLPNGTIFGWQFEKDRRAVQVNVDGRLIVDDIDLSIRAVLDGIGLEEDLIPAILRKSGIKLTRFQHILRSYCFECGLQAGFAHCSGFLAIVLGLTK